MLGLYLIHPSGTLTDVPTLCVPHPWMPLLEKSLSQTFCWCLERFLPEAFCLHQQRCMEEVITFLLIRSLLIKEGLSIFCLLLVSQQVSHHLVSHCRPHFPKHHRLCCSGLSFQEIKSFPVLSWGEKGCLTCGIGHAAAFSSHPLIGHVHISPLFRLLIIMVMMVLLVLCLIGLIIRGNSCQ